MYKAVFLKKSKSMRTVVSLFVVLGIFVFQGCKNAPKNLKNDKERSVFTIAFGSCNRTDFANVLWDDIRLEKPDVWIWGGDVIYADTDDMTKLEAMYKSQDTVSAYQKMTAEVPVIGTWDDHDYGLNDGGTEFKVKNESKALFLDFIKVDKNDKRRKREGVYAMHSYRLKGGLVNVFVLDTRFFRTGLTPDTTGTKRYQPNTYGKGTILGVQQWKWLEDGLKESKADFNILVTSVQFLSNKHGFEMWGNFPHEVDRLEKFIGDHKIKNVVLLSGDRHISEFSKKKIAGLSYPLIDFTSSGLTHVYDGFHGEENQYRIGEVVFEKSYGILKVDLTKKKISFKMKGDGNKVLGELNQSY